MMSLLLFEACRFLLAVMLILSITFMDLTNCFLL